MGAIERALGGPVLVSRRSESPARMGLGQHPMSHGRRSKSSELEVVSPPNLGPLSIRFRFYAGKPTLRSFQETSTTVPGVTASYRLGQRTRRGLAFALRKTVMAWRKSPAPPSSRSQPLSALA